MVGGASWSEWADRDGSVTTGDLRKPYAVSGKAYYAALDPRVWPAPSFRKVGKGVQAVYLLRQHEA